MEIKSLFQVMPQIGKIRWIGIRPGKGEALIEKDEIKLSEVDGIIGDHYGGRSGNRQVTLIQQEHLDAVGHILGQEISPFQTRRNLVVEGINLLAFKSQKIKLGDQIILEYTGLCHPCTRMEKNLGPGGYNAMRGHGGITARIIQGGTLLLGDTVSLLNQKIRSHEA